MLVLVTDDNSATRLIARAILEREGCEVSLAGSGPDALALARVRAFDAVLLDIMMPGMDGLRVVRRLKDAAPDLPVFAHTSYVSPSDIGGYLRAGFDGVIAKPLAAGALSRALKSVGDGAPALINDTRVETAALEGLPLIDQSVVEQGIGRVAEDAARTVLRHYRSSLADQVRQLQQTLPGALALDPVDLGMFRTALHGLKSGSAMIGMLRAPALAGQLRNAPPAELRAGVTTLIKVMRETLPALEDAQRRARRSACGSVALGQAGSGVEMRGKHQAEPAHHDEHDRAAI